MTNVTNALRRAQAGGVLNLPELLAVAGHAPRDSQRLGLAEKRARGIRTALDYRFETLQPNKFLEERISMTVVNEEEVADTRERRARVDPPEDPRGVAARVREQLDKMIRSQTYQKYLQEAIVTQRGGRYVVPVKGRVPQRGQGPRARFLRQRRDRVHRADRRRGGEQRDPRPAAPTSRRRSTAFWRSCRARSANSPTGIVQSYRAGRRAEPDLREGPSSPIR